MPVSDEKTQKKMERIPLYNEVLKFRIIQGQYYHVGACNEEVSEEFFRSLRMAYKIGNINSSNNPILWRVENSKEGKQAAINMYNQLRVILKCMNSSERHEVKKVFNFFKII